MADIIDINAPGWQGVEAESPLPVPETESQQGKVDRALAHILDTPDGEVLYSWLENNFLLQPTWAPAYDTDFGFFREGQNTLIREMIHRAARARGTHDG